MQTAQAKLMCAVLGKLANKQILVGCLDHSDMAVETPETVVARIKRALAYVEPDRIVLAPDCGMKYLPADVAFAKLRSIVTAAAMLRSRSEERRVGKEWRCGG